MANASFPSGGVDTSHFREDGDHYYTTYKWVYPGSNAAAPAAGVYNLGSIRINGTGTVHIARVKVADITDTAIAVGSYDFDILRAPATAVIGAAATITTGALVFATDGIADANVWHNFTLTAAGTRVATGDILLVQLVAGGGAAPTGGECPELEVIVRSDF